jgi:hypothetical protein
MKLQWYSPSVIRVCTSYRVSSFVTVVADRDLRERLNRYATQQEVIRSYRRLAHKIGYLLQLPEKILNVVWLSCVRSGL